MARLDGLGSDLEEKMVGLAGEVSSLDLRITNNLTALGECAGAAWRLEGILSFISIFDISGKQQSQDRDNLLTLTIEMYSVFGKISMNISGSHSSVS